MRKLILAIRELIRRYTTLPNLHEIRDWEIERDFAFGRSARQELLDFVRWEWELTQDRTEQDHDH